MRLTRVDLRQIYRAQGELLAAAGDHYWWALLLDRLRSRIASRRSDG
jgi:hypothetical protein